MCKWGIKGTLQITCTIMDSCCRIQNDHTHSPPKPERQSRLSVRQFLIITWDTFSMQESFYWTKHNPGLISWDTWISMTGFPILVSLLFYDTRESCLSAICSSQCKSDLTEEIRYICVLPSLQQTTVVTELAYLQCRTGPKVTVCVNDSCQGAEEPMEHFACPSNNQCSNSHKP